jgi:hypothetical protein
MHIGPIPEGFMQFEVYRFIGHPNRWMKIGVAWPTLKQAERFRDSYEQANGLQFGSMTFAIVEKVTTFKILDTDEASTKPHTGSAREV